MKGFIIAAIFWLLTSCSQKTVEGSVISKKEDFRGMVCYTLSSGNNKEVGNISVCNHGDYYIEIGRKVRVTQKRGITIYSSKILEVIYL